MTYAQAGVNVAHQREAHWILARRLESTFQTRAGKIGRPIFPIGHYAGLIDIGHGQVLSLHTDSVGTKVAVARMMHKYDTIGIDCVAMCANDLICTGSEPISFLDYMAMAKPDRAIVEKVAIGLAKGAKAAGMAIVGGETAIVPELLSADWGFDLTGFAAGICRRKELILGDKIEEGDEIIGVASSGIHSNGLTLARKVLLRKYGIRDVPKRLGRSIGEELLEPTRIYVKPVKELIEKVDVHGLAHITGGAFSKLERVLAQSQVGALLDRLPAPPPIFELIQKTGRVSKREMYKTFNMGVGLVVFCEEHETRKTVGVFRRHGQKSMKIGQVTKESGVRIVDGSRQELCLSHNS